MKTVRILAIFAVGLGVAVVVRAADLDARIEAAAKQSYVFRTQLKGDSIHVQSKGGVVTLTGTVSDESHKSLAEDTVTSLPGVQSVDDQLVVNEQPAEKSDAWITTKVKAALLFHRSVSALTQVDTKDGVVTLRGTADNQAEKDLTTQYAQDVDGVTRVDNEMTVVSSPPSEPTMGQKIDDTSITAQVKFTLLAHRSTSALRTHVETNKGVVTLRGNAKSQAEIDLVTALVKDIDGVKAVKNEMKIQQ